MAGFLIGLGLGVLGIFLWMMRTQAALRRLVSDQHLEALVSCWSALRDAEAAGEDAHGETFEGVGLSVRRAAGVRRLQATLGRGVPTVALPWVAAVLGELSGLPVGPDGFVVTTHGPRTCSLPAPDTLPEPPAALTALREAAANRLRDVRLRAA
jgi:hypothetical protein